MAENPFLNPFSFKPIHEYHTFSYFHPSLRINIHPESNQHHLLSLSIYLLSNCFSFVESIHHLAPMSRILRGASSLSL
ncbi:unnamed protein product [Caenorhabditis nigoni]